MEAIISQINPWIFIAFGVVLIGLEMLTMAFVLIFFGASFVIIGLLSFYIELSGEVQILAAVILGALLTFLLRKAILKTMRPKDLPLETLATGDTGVLSEYNGDLRVNYKGTTWAVDTLSDDSFKDGEKVIVKELVNNVAIISKL